MTTENAPTCEHGRPLPESIIGYIAACFCDREPKPGDGPDYHADHAAWERRS